MELKIGARIAELRKAKGMTQEQLAIALGISASEVNQWETEISYPDIVQLCPLARILATNVDTLLEYEEVLSEEKIRTFANEIVETEREQGVLAADEKLQKILRRYPNSIPLKFQAVTMLTVFQVQNPDCSETQKNQWEQQKKILLEEVYESKDAAFLYPAVSALIACALRDGEFAKAEKLLKGLPENNEDVTALWVQLYLRKGDRKKASQLLQRKLYLLTNQILSFLSLMIETVESDHDKALKLCEIYQNMEDVFAIGGKTSEMIYALIYHKAGREEEATERIIRYLKNCMEEMPEPNPLLFAPTIKRTASGRNISNEMILRGLFADESFAKIRENEEIQRLLKTIGGAAHEG